MAQLEDTEDFNDFERDKAADLVDGLFNIGGLDTAYAPTAYTNFALLRSIRTHRTMIAITERGDFEESFVGYFETQEDFDAYMAGVRAFTADDVRISGGYVFV